MAKMQGALVRVRTEEGMMPLSPAREILQNRYTFEELRLARLFV
jgi:hypothetical protein